MSRKEPTRHQLSSRLAYSQSTPAFLQRLKNQVSGGSSYRDDEHAESAAFDEWEASSGRVPIPRRPQSEHGDDDANKDNDKNDFEEDETDDEKPMVVVLKEGRHLSATEADDERRKGKFLPFIYTPVYRLSPRRLYKYIELTQGFCLILSINSKGTSSKGEGSR